MTGLLDAEAFEANALAVADTLRAIANQRRLQILCVLIETDEMTVSAIVARIGISQSAVSQHLARMRDERLVTFRRDGQALFYRIADPRIRDLIAELYRLYCAGV